MSTENRAKISKAFDCHEDQNVLTRTRKNTKNLKTDVSFSARGPKRWTLRDDCQDEYDTIDCAVQRPESQCVCGAERWELGPPGAVRTNQNGPVTNQNKSFIVRVCLRARSRVFYEFNGVCVCVDHIY